jgi:hypothetical protein
MHGGMSMIEEIREVDTDIYQAYGEVMGRDIRNQQDIQHDRLPKEQAAAIACYTSDDASYLTGQVLNCSGRAVVGAYLAAAWAAISASHGPGKRPFSV